MKSAYIFIILILTSISAITQPVLNVVDFGARGDGENDDTKAIQAAINKADPKIFTTIFFPAGTYKIGSFTTTSNYLENYCLKIHSNIYFKGSGDGSIIKLADQLFSRPDSNTNAHIFYGHSVENIKYTDLLIDMNGAKNLVPKNFIRNNAGIFTSYGKNIYIENITIKNCSGTNMINIMSKGTGLTIKNCRFINGGNYVGSNKLINEHQIDFSFVYSEWDNTHISNIVIKQENIDIALADYTGGIEIHGVNSSISNSTITGCFPGIYLSSSYYEKYNVKVIDNQLIDCVEGIAFWLVYPMKDIIIKNNSIQLTPHRNTDNKIVSGIKMPNGNALEYSKKLANNAPVSNLQIIDNIISAPAMNNLSAGMLLHSLHSSCIQNNIITGMNYAGIGLMGSKWGSNKLQISKNNFWDFNINQDKNAVAGYIVITDTYTPFNKSAPGLNNILFNNNRFTRNNASKNASINSKNIFKGVFIALPQKMQKQIRFKKNLFTDKDEKIHAVNTD